MNALVIIRTAISSLGANKLRAGLTLLGIVIGVAAVITLMSIGRGVQATITERIQALGTNLLFVRPGETSSRGVGGGQGSASSLTIEDAYALSESEFTPSISAVAPELGSSAQVVAGRKNTFANITGVTPEYEEVRNAPVEFGRFISQGDVDRNATVAVLGYQVAQDLYGFRSPIGQPIRISGRQFEVIGVLEEQGGSSFFSFDDRIMVPITAAYYRLASSRTTQGGISVQTINVKTQGVQVMDSALAEVATILRLRHRITGEDDFTVTSQQEDDRGPGRGYQRFCFLPGSDCRDFPAGGRHRNHEHHAGVGYRTDTGNRNPQGHGGQTARYSAPVRLGGNLAELGRRRSGTVPWLGFVEYAKRPGDNRHQPHPDCL